MRDLREAFRSLRATPIVTIVAVTSLALGIGGATAIFGILDAMILRPLPVSEPDRLVSIASGSERSAALPHAVWDEIRERRLFEDAFAWSFNRFNTAPRGPVDLVDGIRASGRIFEVLGLRAQLGRTFTELDDLPGGGVDGPVVVISHRFWQRRFGGAPDVLGQALTLEGARFTVVGVLPPRFVGLDVGLPFDVAVPMVAAALTTSATSPLTRYGYYVSVMARLGPGQSLDAASGGIGGGWLPSREDPPPTHPLPPPPPSLRPPQPRIRDATMPAFEHASDRDAYLANALRLHPARSGISFLHRRYERPVVVVFALVNLVLLIACANVASLLLVKTQARRGELGVRLALGASRVGLARLLVLEGLVVSFAGAALGLVVAWWAGPLLVRQLSTQAYDVYLDLAIDWRVLGAAVLFASIATLLSAAMPAVRASRARPLHALRTTRTTEECASLGAGSGVMVVQVAVSFVIVAAAGLFGRTFAVLANMPAGMDRDAVLVAVVDTGRSDVNAAGRPAMYERLAQAAGAVPGVAAAAASAAMPAGNLRIAPLVEIPGGPSVFPPDRFVRGNVVTPGWFRTLGIRLEAGRDVDASDRAGAPRVAVVNRAFARYFLPGQDAIGQTIFERTGVSERYPVRIVGVVSDAVSDSIRISPQPAIYFPVAQSASRELMDVPQINVSVRAAAGSPEALARSVADAIGRTDPTGSLTFRTLRDQIDAAFRQERLVAALAGWFGGFSLLLAGIGLYGVTAHAVARRRIEIGLRLALGAAPAAVVRLVMRRVAGLVALGLVIGVGVALWSARLVVSLLFGVQPHDPPTLVLAAAVLVLCASGAAWIPARRAARLDPLTVLRAEG